MIKRRFLVIILAISLAFTMFFTSALGTSPVLNSIDLKYDVDSSGAVNLSDVVVLAQYVAGWDGLTYDATKLDTNENNIVDLNDVVYLAQVVAGWDMSPVYSENISGYNWPNISPSDVEAGLSVTERRESDSTEPLAQFMLMEDINTTLPFSVECYIKDNVVTALLPAGTYLTELKPEFTINGDKLICEGVEVVSGVTVFDFTRPVNLSVVSGDTKTDYTVYVMTLDTGVPSISISTADNTLIESKTEYEACTVFAGGGDLSNGDYSFDKNEYIKADATIKGRGWTSWYYYPKKSYTLKFDKKQEMPGLPAHKEWVLAANFADRSLVRNAAAMELAHNVGMETVMDVRFVDLWVNGVYEGSYQLIEKIEVGSDRVDITKFDENLAPDEIGYIVETNGHNKAEGEFGVWTNGQDADRPSLWQELNDNITLDPISGDMFFNSRYYDIIYNINKPSDSKIMALEEDKRQEYLDYIYNYMDLLENAIKSRDYAAASEYLDMEAMAKWYIVEELSMNTDSKLHCSCYMYKDAGGKMKMGPVWDFDLGFGNGKYAWNTSDTYLDNAKWFADLLAMPQFKAQVKKVWNNSTGKISKLPEFIENTSKMIEKSADINYEVWSITEPAEHTLEYSTEMLTTYEEQIDYLTTFTEERISYMNNKISKW